MEEKKTPGLTITEEPGGRIRKRLLDFDGTLLLDETVLPHDDLIRFTDKQLKEYMRQLNEIEMHSLFKESMDVSEQDYRDIVTKFYAVADSFRESFPEAYFFFEFCAVLRSSKRIARCQYCWRYFVPKTNKKTDYCDRKWSDGRTCKMHGPNLKRKDGPAEDKYLLAFKRLRARFYEREYRCYATAPGKTVPGGYKDWIEEACEARDEYVEGKITGEELLRRINPEEEQLDAELEPEPFSVQKRLSLTPWDELVERGISFDPRRHFETMQFIDLGEENPQWRTITAKEREIDAKQGKVRLREKYKK